MIVALVVDQFAADLFEQYRNTYVAGLKRLSDGVVFVDGYQSHAATETCPGHSTILTGRHPAATGIIANEWYDRAMGRSVYCVAVPGAQPAARGPQSLRVDTLGTWLKAAQTGAQVVSVSGKDRAAIMLAGHNADAVYWWNDGLGFGTSSFAGPVDGWVMDPAQQFNSATFSGWRTEAPATWPTTVPPRCAALERPEHFGGIALSGDVPPDDQTNVASDKGFAASLRASPLLDSLTLQFAAQLTMSRRLGRGRATDLLAVSLSATDYIGHRYGKGGPEMCAQMAELDRSLGQFFQRLDATGLAYIVVMTADHGSSDAPERALRSGATARRIDGAAMLRALNRHLRHQFNLSQDPIEGSGIQELTLAINGEPSRIHRIRAEALRWLKGRRRDVVTVFTREEVMAAAPPVGVGPEKLTLAQRFHESFDAERSGDLFVVLPKAASPLAPTATGDAVAGHGSPWNYDRRVPIAFWWPGVPRETVSRSVETVDIAPTLASLAGVTTPLLDGKCLREVAACEGLRVQGAP